MAETLKLVASWCSDSTEVLDGPPSCNETVWILGISYETLTDNEALLNDIRSRLWFTYRRNFEAIGESGMTSDKGWGCMLRCGQMVIAQALLNLHIGRSPYWPITDDSTTVTYRKILSQFQDKETSAYSIHQLAQTGVSEGKEIGEWFGPNTVAQVLKKLSALEKWSSLKIHIAMDNTVITEEVENLCFHSSGEIKEWSALLLVIPLRLGLININPIYKQGLKICLEIPQTVGIIGGKPSQALYFIGYTGDDVIYLDPHVTQNFIDLDNEEFDDLTYHPDNYSRISFESLDPSLALCFFCKTHEDWRDLLDRFQRLIEQEDNQNLFEICATRQAEWLPASRLVAVDDGATFETASDDDSEEFEILG